MGLRSTPASSLHRHRQTKYEELCAAGITPIQNDSNIKNKDAKVMVVEPRTLHSLTCRSIRQQEAIVGTVPGTKQITYSTHVRNEKGTYGFEVAENQTSVIYLKGSEKRPFVQGNNIFM